MICFFKISIISGTARIYDISELKEIDVSEPCDPSPAPVIAVCLGHEAGITKICWAPNGYRIFTASQDNTVKVWSTDSGECLQTLEGIYFLITHCNFFWIQRFKFNTSFRNLNE